VNNLNQNSGQDSRTLYLFVDESGNFDFSSPKGTKYFTLASVSTFNPCLFKEKILGFKYELLEKGYNKEMFHATEDEQVVRDKIFGFIKDLSGDFEIDSVIVQKNKTNPTLYNEIKRKKGTLITRQVGTKLYRIKPFQIYFHKSNSDLNCQIADYCCWAISIKWERGERRSYDILSNAKMIKSEFDIFQFGRQEYYQYK